MAVIQPQVLLVEDEPAQREVLAYNLEAEGFAVRRAENGEEAMMLIAEAAPDLIILDWMMPLMSGIEVCRQLKTRPETRAIPIIMLSARSEEVDTVRGLETGADDYIHKPFKPKELVARVRARLRRQPEERPDTVTVADLTIDVGGHRVCRGEEEISLTPIEFELLVVMATRPGQVFSREALMEKVWGYRKASDTRLVNVHIQRLRSKIEHDVDDPQIIQTVRGIGYKTGA